MRFAILGDIHANLEALDAVLADADSEGCTNYVCVGDIVGYGGNPEECVERIRAVGCPTVKGDFDESASLETSLDNLNPAAQRMILWTRSQLSSGNRKWLQDLDLVLEVDGFTAVHASLESPELWMYLMSEFDAMASFSCQQTQLCFLGHTHIPKFYVRSHSIFMESGDRIKLAAGTKYLINVGSVGQPRDGDGRACYAIYDPAKSLVRIKRVEYDMVSARRKMPDGFH